MNREHLTLAAVLIIALLVPAGSALADVAPPQYAQGGSIDPHGTTTQVRMAAEQVLLTVEDESNLGPNTAGLAAGLMRARVEADFVMHNAGTAQEAFDVWFPLSAPNGFGDINRVADFAAEVNGEPARIVEQQAPGEWDEMVAWATWPVTFPAGEDVNIKVTYTTWPTGYRPYGTFEYILETGAGWAGPIGAGTVTFRLPYAVTADNAALDIAGAPDVSGQDVTWTFANLEPARENNLSLTVLAPPVWREIQAAREAVLAAPGHDAQLRLARALVAALSFKYGLNEIGNSAALAAQADQAYQQVITLAPDDAAGYIEYCEFLQSMSGPMGPVPANLVPTLERALELAPDDEFLLQLKAWVDQLPPEALTPAPAMPTATQVPAVTLPPPLATPTPPPNTRPPESTATPPPPPPTAAPATATPAPATPPDRICPSAAALALVPLGLVGLARFRRRAARD